MKILEAFPFPWDHPVAQQLHLTLTQSFPSRTAASNVIEAAGLPAWKINLEQSSFFIWRDVLSEGSTAGLNTAIAQRALALVGVSSPACPFLEELIKGGAPAVEEEPRGLDGAPEFIVANDEISEPEALLY